MININPIKSFSILKRKEQNDDKKPSHNISTKIGEVYKIIGGAWTKENQFGKYLSCKLRDPFSDMSNTLNSIDGYVIVAQSELDQLIKEHALLQGITEKKVDEELQDQIPF